VTFLDFGDFLQSYRQGLQESPNNVIDALHESGRIDSRQDKFMHLVNEMMTGSGQPDGSSYSFVGSGTYLVND